MSILRDRFGLLHPDGSITVLPPQATLGWARREALALDENQDSADKWTRIARLRIAVVEALETPSAAAAARVARRTRCHAG